MPLQKGVHMAQLQGDEDALVLPVAITQISPDPQFPQGGMHCDYNATPFKTIKEIKQACTQYRTSSPYTRKTSISALLTMPKPLTVWITINCGKF